MTSNSGYYVSFLGCHFREKAVATFHCSQSYPHHSLNLHTICPYHKPGLLPSPLGTTSIEDSDHL